MLTGQDSRISGINWDSLGQMGLEMCISLKCEKCEKLLHLKAKLDWGLHANPFI